MNNHKDLDVWKRSVDVVTAIYELTAGFPEQEKFGLTNQMRRAAVSIPSNIAEGSARFHAKDFIHFLRISDGSAAELETQLIISHKLGFAVEIESTVNDINIIRRMLAALIKSLRK